MTQPRESKIQDLKRQFRDDPSDDLLPIEDFVKILLKLDDPVQVGEWANAYVQLVSLKSAPKVLAWLEAQEASLQNLETDKINERTVVNLIANFIAYKIEHSRPRRDTESNSIVDQEVDQGLGLYAPVGLETDVAKRTEPFSSVDELPATPSKIWVRRDRGRKSKDEQTKADAEVIAFVREVYGPYIARFRGKLYAYIRKHDPALFTAISYLKRHNRLPSDVYITSRDENVDELIGKAQRSGRVSLTKPERRKVTGAVSRRKKSDSFDP